MELEHGGGAATEHSDAASIPRSLLPQHPAPRFSYRSNGQRKSECATGAGPAQSRILELDQQRPDFHDGCGLSPKLPAHPQFKDFGYPPGTDENVPHYELAGYIHRYVRRFGLEELISFNTRVEDATKTDGRWVLRLRKLHGPDAHLVETVWDEVRISYHRF
jgi:hypothetical protein